MVCSPAVVKAYQLSVALHGELHAVVCVRNHRSILVCNRDCNVAEIVSVGVNSVSVSLRLDLGGLSGRLNYISSHCIGNLTAGSVLRHCPQRSILIRNLPGAVQVLMGCVVLVVALIHLISIEAFAAVICLAVLLSHGLASQ